MDGTYDPSFYGDLWAANYDEVFPPDPRLDAMVDRLVALAGGGPVLELAIGTGRIALPLVARGVEVAGVDASEKMVERLRAKPGGAAIPATIGDMTEIRVDGEFAVVLLAFNTLFALPDQDRQIACFANAGRHLAPDGVFVIEAFVPDPARFDRGQRVSTSSIAPDVAALELAQHDAAGQTVHAALVRITPDGTRILPVDIRYAWPAEMDLMARLAGLRLVDRWAGWDMSPFDADATMHVSVYERA